MADNLLKPIATPEQDFILMLHDRLIVLEKLIDTQQNEIEFAKKYMESNQLRYNLFKNEMTDGATIDWDITKNSSNIKVVYYDSGIELKPTQFHFNASVFFENKTIDPDCSIDITILFPIDIHSRGFIPVKISTVYLTLEKLLNIIYDFYNKIVLPEDINNAEDYMKSYNFICTTKIKLYKEYVNNKTTLTWIDLINYNNKNKAITFLGIRLRKYTNEYELVIA